MESEVLFYFILQLHEGWSGLRQAVQAFGHDLLEKLAALDGLLKPMLLVVPHQSDDLVLGQAFVGYLFRQQLPKDHSKAVDV